jgi:PhnB protein
MAVKPIPEGYHTVTPFMLAKDAAKLIDFIIAAFDAVQKHRHDVGGKVMHAEIKIGDSIIMLAEANEKWPASPSILYLYVNDVDSTYRQALQAGGTSLREPTTEFYGDRSCGVVDAFGNQWWIATHVEDVSPEELKRRQEDMTKSHSTPQ